MKLLFGGDLFLSEELNESPNISTSVRKFFEGSDFSILNQESCFCNFDGMTSEPKTGPSIKSSKNITIKFLKSLNVDYVTLANNHIFDYGEKV